MNRKEKMIQRCQELEAEGLYAEADDLFQASRWICDCGKDAHEQFDAHGVYAGRLCDRCFRQKFRQDRYDIYADGYSAPGEGFFD